MTNYNIYLYFPGNCEAAFAFYEQVFQQKITIKSHFKDMPDSENCEIDASDENKVMHLTLPLNQHFNLMGCDAIGDMAENLKDGNNFSVSINPDNLDETQRLFEALSDGGKVTMPLEKSFWGSYFGMLVDRFGIHWMINYAIPQDN